MYVYLLKGDISLVFIGLTNLRVEYEGEDNRYCKNEAKIPSCL